MRKKLKTIPRFDTEEEERLFWETHDSADYVDWDNAVRARLPNLKLSRETGPEREKSAGDKAAD